MELSAARQVVAGVDATDRDQRAARLVELDGLLPDVLQLGGTAAERLFEDVKATWIYGYLAATVVVAEALCMQQLGARLRELEHVDGLPDRSSSLPELIDLAFNRELIDDGLRAELVDLADSSRRYSVVGVIAHDPVLEIHDAEAETFLDEPSLLADARGALACSVAMVRALS